MKRFVGGSLAVLFVVFSLMFTISCAKKAVQAEPSVQTEPAAEEPEQDTEEVDEEAMEERRLEEERLAAEQARLQAEQEAMAAKEIFLSEDIYFDFDSSAILIPAQDLLQKKAAWMTDNPEAKVIVEGHCDERGTEAYNLALGERRASAVKTYLIDLGIDPARLITISYGEERPIDPGRTEAAWIKNRRAHFTLEK